MITLAGYIVVYLQGSDKTLAFPTSGYSSGEYLSVDIVQKTPIECAATPDEVSPSTMKRRLASSDATPKKAKSDKSDSMKTRTNNKDKFTVRPLPKKMHPGHKKKTPPLPVTTEQSLLGSIQPSSLNWRSPFDGLISPVIVVGGNTGVASEKWFDRCNNMVFVTKIEGASVSVKK